MNTVANSQQATLLVLRTCDADMTSYGGFVWPTSGYVEAPDRDATDIGGGHGLHGLPWGVGNAGHLSVRDDAKWLVVKVAEADCWSGNGNLTDKCKFRCGNVVYCGDRDGAIAYLHDHGADKTRCVFSPCSTSENQSPCSSSGDGSPCSSSGDGSPCSSSGYESPCSSSGDRSPCSSSGNQSPCSSSGDGSMAMCLGLNGMVRAGGRSVIGCTWWDEKADRPRITIGYTGEDGIEPHTWYRLKYGKFVAVREADRPQEVCEP